MATTKRSGVAEGLSTLYGICLKRDTSDKDSAAIAQVIDALENASRAGDSLALEKLARAARKLVPKRRGPTLAPMRHELIRALVSVASREMKKSHPSDQRGAYIAEELVVVGYHHLLLLGLPPEVHSTAAFYARAAALIDRALWKQEPSPKDIVTALLVAYGMQRRAARGVVQSAFRRD